MSHRTYHSRNSTIDANISPDQYVIIAGSLSYTKSVTAALSYAAALVLQ